MKTRIAIILISVAALTIAARIITPFHGWEWVHGTSPDIMVVVAREPVPPTPGLSVENATISDFSVFVLAVLKGTNAPGNIRLQTDQELRKGEAFLAFGQLENGVCKAYEDYRVVPLGMLYKQEMIAGKPLNDQLHILFRVAITNLDQRMQMYQAERRQFEQGSE